MVLKVKKSKGKKRIPLIDYNKPDLLIAERYRQIRTNLLYASIDYEIKSIMVTSSKPGDGKTTTAVNLAIVLAKQQKKVLLVDADLRNPSLHFTFNISNLNGLTNVLTKQSNLDVAITPSGIPYLNILPSGELPHNPSELLGSKVMQSTIEKLREKFDYIVFDTPPVLLVADAQILANKCDGVVFVIDGDKTQKSHAIKAKILLETVQSRLLGVIVNGVASEENEYYGR